MLLIVNILVFPLCNGIQHLDQWLLILILARVVKVPICLFRGNGQQGHSTCLNCSIRSHTKEYIMIHASSNSLHIMQYDCKQVHDDPCQTHLKTITHRTSLIPRPFIQHVYRFQYNMKSDLCWGWLGLGPISRLTPHVLSVQ